MITYRVLSYTWSDFLEKATAITITCMDYVHPTANLHKPLTQVRSSILNDKPRTDPIFVGKADLDERSKQVNMMPDTFQCASKVVFWIAKDGLRTSDIPPLLSEVASASNCLASAAKGAPQYDILPLETTKLPYVTLYGLLSCSLVTEHGLRGGFGSLKRLSLLAITRSYAAS